MSLLRVLLVAVIAAAGYFALFGGEYGLFELWRLEKQRERELVELEAFREEVAQLRARADSLESDSATLERIARERYGLIRDGERLYRFVDDPDQDATGSGEPRR